MIRTRLKELSVELPPVHPPVASYVSAKRSGDHIFISGQLPIKNGEIVMKGLMTKERSMEEAKKAMEIAFINGLAAACSIVDADLIDEVVKVSAFVASSPDFNEQHLVANGASDFAVKIFGEKGKHARAAVGVASLPLNATVELEIIFSIKAGSSNVQNG